MRAQTMTPDRTKADDFLSALAPESDRFTFQSFTDDKVVRDRYKAEGNRDPLARVLHGTLSDQWKVLAELSMAGAGVYIVINETNLRGRTTADIIRVRAYFVDMDGAPLANLSQVGLRPHICVQSSPGRFHVYWRVEGAPLDQFKDAQHRLATLSGSDPNVCDLPRVMRLPGFPHQKQYDGPFLVECIASESFPAYGDADFRDNLAAMETEHLARPDMHGQRKLIAGGMAGISGRPDMTQGYPDGERTHELTRRAGWCLGPANMTELQATEACLGWNRYNTPPLPDEKILSTVASIARAETKKREIKAQGTGVAAETVPDTEHEPQATFKRLAGLLPFEYDRLRVKEAERLGIRVGTLDDEVDKFRELHELYVDDDASPGAGRPLKLPLPEPWPEPVEGVLLLNEIATAFHRYVVLPPEAIVACTLFVVYAHAFEAWSISPRLAITSPEMQCGKSTLLSVLEPLVPKALKADNVTAAAVFRVVEAARPTLLIDEADSFFKDNEELRGILNSGHRSNGQVIRLVGDNHEPRTFSTWCPTVIAAIGRIPGTLEDRSVSISMRRALPQEVVTRFDDKERVALSPLASKAARWAHDHLELLRGADPEMPGCLHGRAADNWRPLLAVAEVMGGAWRDLARDAAVKLSLHTSADHGSVRVQLLADIRALFEERKAERMTSVEMVAALCALEGRPWQDWGKGKAMTPNQLARQLAPFNVKPKTLRVSAGKPDKGYDRSFFEDAFTRYLPPPGPPDEP